MPADNITPTPPGDEVSSVALPLPEAAWDRSQPGVLASIGPVTAVRYGVLGLTVAMAVLLYLDRVCISLLGLKLQKDLDLSELELGLVFSTFFLAYALAQVPTGWLGDRLGARLMLTGCVLAWSLLTGLTGMVAGLLSLTAVRLLFGVSQAGAYPIAARINSVWIPLQRRAFASGLITLGGRAGGALAPLLTTALLWVLDDWRSVFVVYALLGLAWAGLFGYWYRATPAEHAGCSRAEVALIGRGRPAVAGTVRGLPWAAACRSRSLWMQCLTQFASNVPWVFLITWMPAYLKKHYAVSLTEVGLLSSLPLLAGMAGCFLGGLVTDWLTAWLGLKWGRNALGMGSKFLAALGLLGCLAAPNAVLATLALAWMSFAVDTGLGATWAYFQDAGGPYVGTLLGWANMFGNLGAFLSPLFIGCLAEGDHWTAALASCVGLYVISGLAWFGVDARVPVVPPSASVAS